MFANRVVTDCPRPAAAGQDLDSFKEADRVGIDLSLVA